MCNSIHNSQQRKRLIHSAAVFAVVGWRKGENWFHAYIKVPNPVGARNCFSLILILLGTNNECQRWPDIGDTRAPAACHAVTCDVT